MKKIQDKYDNIFDVTCYNIAALLSPLFKYFNFTPNMITYLNIITSILSIYYLYHLDYNLAALFLVITYILDCCDGYYARKYKKETYFGDLLDHYTDYILHISVYYLLLTKVQLKNKTIFTIILMFLSIFALIHMGCIEHYNKTNKQINTHLSKLKKMCLKKEYIHITKYLGPGTLYLYIILGLLFYTKKI